MTERNKLVEQLYQEYKDLIYVVAFHVLKNKDYAEDAVQATIEKILLKPEKFYEIKSDKVKNYVASTARNTALDIYRKNSLCRIREVSFEDINYTPSIELALCEEDELDFPFNQLYDSYKEILYLKYECGYTLKEIGDILGISEANAKKRISRARKQLEKIIKTGTVVVLCIVILALTGVAINAATDGKFFAAIREFFGAEIVTDENRNLVGKEIIYNETPVPQKEGTIEGIEETPEKALFTGTQIVTSVTDGAPIPVSITEVKTEGGIIPKVIMTSSASVIFYQNDYAGWKCHPGDVLSLEFSKYKTENGTYQTLYIGLVINGVMQEGAIFDGLSGKYQMKIKSEGEYYIYLFSISSDYQTLKSGKITINSK